MKHNIKKDKYYFVQWRGSQKGYYILIKKIDNRFGEILYLCKCFNCIRRNPKGMMRRESLDTFKEDLKCDEVREVSKIEEILKIKK